MPLDDIKRFRQLDSRCPGHPEYRWTSGVETTTGPLGQGVATSVGMAIASKWMAAQFNRPDFEMFDFDVYALAGDGCMMEGISGEAASLAGHLEPRQPLLDLRQQPHHHRRPHDAGLQRGRRHALHRLRLERHARRRRQRLDDARSRVPDVQGDEGPADADHRRQPHRLRRADQAGHARRARRAARRRGDPAREALLWLAGGRESSSCPTACASTSPANMGARGADAAGPTGWRASTPTRPSIPGSRRALSDAAAAAARRLGGRDSDVPGRRQRARRPRRVGKGAERGRPEGAVADRRLGRSRAVDEDAAHLRRRRRFRSAAVTAAAISTSASASTRWAPC